MGRRRRTNTHLPRGMYHRHGAYYLVKCGKWTRLARDYAQALVKYSELVGRKAAPIVTISGAVAQYLEASATRLAPKTLDGYRQSAKRLLPVFGHMHLDELEPAHVYRYMVERGDVAANRDRALLSAAYTHARNVGEFRADDPTKGMHYRNPEKPRERYITDPELAALIAVATPKMRCIIRLIALTGMRQGDALRIKVTDIDDEGIHYRQGKTGKRLVVLWSDELRAVVDDSTRLWRRFGRTWLFESHPRGRHAKRGIGPYTTSGLRAMWRRTTARADIEDARLHDLRGKAGSDVDTVQDAQRLLGHADAKITGRHYRRKPDRVRPVR